MESETVKQIDVVIVLKKTDYSKLGFPTPFIEASHGNLENLVKCTLESKENGNFGLDVIFQGKSIIHAAVEGNNPEVIEFLAQQGAPLNSYDKEGIAPLHFAAWFGLKEAVQALIKCNANIDVQCKPYGMSAAHYAVCSENTAVLSVLSESNANINIQDIRKRTPLHYVAMLCSLELLRVLIKRKVEMEIPDEDGRSPTDIVYEHDDYDLLLIMTNNGADISKFYDEAWNEKLRKVKEGEDEEEDDSDTNSTDFYGFYPSQKRKKNEPQRDIKNRHVKKWKRNIILSPDDIPKKRKIRIIKRIYKDRLPDDLRSDFWKFCLQLKEDQYKTEYEDLVEKKIALEEASQIDKDINRTIRAHESYYSRYGEGQCKLFRVLRAYTVYNSETRYTQGMSTIAAILLIYFPSEELAFGAMRVLFEKYGLNELYANGLTGLQKYVFPIFQQLVEQHLPRLHQHLVKFIFNDYCGLFVPNWFLELFFDSLPWPLMLKIWDTFLWTGPSALYSISIALLALLQDTILQKTDMSQIIKVIKGTSELAIDGKKLLRIAYKYHITSETINRHKSRIDSA